MPQEPQPGLDRPPATADPAVASWQAEASRLLAGGDLEGAERLYRERIDAGGADAGVFSNLAAIALQRDQPEAALSWLQRGLALDPANARCQLHRGMALHALGRNGEAIAALRRALAADPALPEAWNNLGVALTAAARMAPIPAELPSAPWMEACKPAGEAQILEAIAAYRRALALHPAFGQAAANLARLLADRGDPGAGEAVLRALPAAARGGEETFALAEMLRLQGRLSEAQELYGAALACTPQPVDLPLQVAVALLSCGQADQALLVLLPVLAERPLDTRPLVAAGAALKAMGDLAQAMELLRSAIALDPAQVKARNLLGICHNEIGEHDQAIAQFEAALEHDPRDSEIRCNLAAALRHQGDLEGSMALIDRLLAEDPECRAACGIQLFSCSIGSERLAPRALEVGARFWELVRREQQGSLAPPRSAGEAAPPPAATAPGADGRLRIGFVSAEIGDHVVGSFLASFLEHHDRRRFAVELFSVSRRFDAQSAGLVAMAERHWQLSGMGAEQARALIRSRRLDVLVETSGFTRDSGIELLAERCAPVQCHYIGFHATTALATIDWFIGDGETVPEAFAPQFVEGLWRLPRPWLARRPDPDLPPARSEARGDAPVLGSFNQLSKVREETLAFWLAALRAVPQARLLIKDRSVADPVICERIRSFLGRGGVTAGRLTFLPALGDWRAHMALYNQIDVALDTTPWSSATTAFDALEMGVPLVAIRGGCTSARMSSSILRGLGKPQWIAESPQAFGAIVAELCGDLDRVRAGKEGLRSEVLASALFDTASMSRALEETWEAMVAHKKGPCHEGPGGACGDGMGVGGAAAIPG